MGTGILPRKRPAGRVIFRHRVRAYSLFNLAIAKAHRQREHFWVDDLLRFKMAALRESHQALPGVWR